VVFIRFLIHFIVYKYKNMKKTYIKIYKNIKKAGIILVYIIAILVIIFGILFYIYAFCILYLNINIKYLYM